jgi:hypothetical protein
MTSKTLRCAAFTFLIASAPLFPGCAPSVSTPGSAGADAPEAVLLAQMRAACGGDAWDKIKGWHERGKVDMVGQSGLTYEAFHEMTTLRTTYVQRLNGKIIRLGGFDGANGWRLRPDGTVETVSDMAQMRKMRRDMYLSNAGYFFPMRFPAKFEVAGVQELAGRTFDVLRITPADAESAELWVDRHTHRVHRIAAGNEVAEGTGYRMFGAVCAPTRLRQGDGDPAHDIILNVEAVDTGPIDPQRFEPGPSAVPR